MVSLIPLAIGALILYVTATKWMALRKNIAMAKESELPYIVVPVYLYWTPWMIVHKPVLRLLRKLPVAFQPEWIPYVACDPTWLNLTSYFDHSGTLRTFLTVAPGGIMLWVANAETLNQITMRRNDFPKPTYIYKAIDIYGKNVITTEGTAWRRHRKVTSPSFSEKNNHLVFEESILQAESMVKDWSRKQGTTTRAITTAAQDCMRLSLHIISLAGFGKHLLWPGIETDDNSSQEKLETGHSLTYHAAIEGLLENLLMVVAIPHKLLGLLPFKSAKSAYQSYTEWGVFMKDMMEAKKIEVSSGGAASGLDLMGALVKSAGYGADASSGKGKEDYLTDQEILGNAFVFLLAGHETTANSIHFALLFLALEIAEQRKLQKDLDSIFGGRKPSEWDYDQDLPRLFSGMTGAVMNETLRLVPPVVDIPKSTITWQSLEIEGKQYKVPPNTYINMCTAVVHRDPEYWPKGPPVPLEEAWHSTSNRDNDLNEFRPSRWLLADSHKKPVSMPSQGGTIEATDDLGINTAADTAETLFKPRRGAYLPFSEGFRSCIGRRFAQVEVLAVLAVMLQSWSIELAVDEYASEEQVAAMSEVERRNLWRKARLDAREKLRTKMGSIITIQLRGGNHVAIRLVPRGQERFDFA